jgi:hypothetical protein
VKSVIDGGPKRFERSRAGFADQRFQLREELLDRIEVGRVARQIEHTCCDGCANPATWRLARYLDSGFQSREKIEPTANLGPDEICEGYRNAY